MITGNKRMKERPIGPLVEALRANGCEIDFLEKEGCLPLKIKNDCLSGGKINLSAKISSQYVSSVLLAAPYSQKPTELKIIGGEVVSEPYIDMTIRMMESALLFFFFFLFSFVFDSGLMVLFFFSLSLFSLLV